MKTKTTNTGLRSKTAMITRLKAEPSTSVEAGKTLRQLVMTQAIEKEDTSLVLFLDGLPAGMYYVTVQTKAGKVTKLLTNLK